MIGMHIMDARRTRARTHKPDRIRHCHPFQRAGYLHPVILSRTHHKRTHPEPPPTGLLLIPYHIGRPARMLDPIRHRRCASGGCCPFDLDLDRA